VITIRITPARRWIRRNQWRYQILAANGRAISDNETYANTGDILDTLSRLVNGDAPVQAEIHYRNGRVETRVLR
jgi:hypothetical protein